MGLPTVNFILRYWQKCVQASFSKFPLQIWVTLHIYYLKFDVHDEWQPKNFEVSSVQQKSDHIAQTPATVLFFLSLNRFMSTACWVAGTSFRQVKWAASPLTSCDYHNELQLGWTYAAIILRDNFVAPLQHFFQLMQGSASILWTEILTLVCLFVLHELFNFLL